MDAEAHNRENTKIKNPRVVGDTGRTNIEREFTRTSDYPLHTRPLLPAWVQTQTRVRVGGGHTQEPCVGQCGTRTPGEEAPITRSSRALGQPLHFHTHTHSPCGVGSGGPGGYDTPCTRCLPLSASCRVQGWSCRVVCLAIIRPHGARCPTTPTNTRVQTRTPVKVAVVLNLVAQGEVLVCVWGGGKGKEGGGREREREGRRRAQVKPNPWATPNVQEGGAPHHGGQGQGVCFGRCHLHTLNRRRR